MINSKALKTAVGVQQSDVVDKTKSTVLPATTHAVVVGRFKRGRTDKPFKVTQANYIGLLGRDIANPSFLAIEDMLRRGVSEVWVARIGSSLDVYDKFDQLEQCFSKGLRRSDIRFGSEYITAYKKAGLA